MTTKHTVGIITVQTDMNIHNAYTVNFKSDFTLFCHMSQVSTQIYYTTVDFDYTIFICWT